MGYIGGATAPRTMNLATALIQLAKVCEAGSDIATALEAIRAGYSDDAYEALEAAHPLIAELVSACCELEDALAEGA